MPCPRLVELPARRSGSPAVSSVSATATARTPPDEYWIIDSANSKVAGMDGTVQFYVDFFYALA